MNRSHQKTLDMIIMAAWSAKISDNDRASILALTAYDRMWSDYKRQQMKRLTNQRKAK